MEFHKKTKEKKGKEIINLKSIRPKAMIIQNNTPTNISNMTRYQKQKFFLTERGKKKVLDNYDQDQNEFFFQRVDTSLKNELNTKAHNNINEYEYYPVLQDQIFENHYGQNIQEIPLKKTRTQNIVVKPLNRPEYLNTSSNIVGENSLLINQNSDKYSNSLIVIDPTSNNINSKNYINEIEANSDKEKDNSFKIRYHRARRYSPFYKNDFGNKIFNNRLYDQELDEEINNNNNTRNIKTYFYNQDLYDIQRNNTNNTNIINDKQFIYSSDDYDQETQNYDNNNNTNNLTVKQKKFVRKLTDIYDPNKNKKGILLPRSKMTFSLSSSPLSFERRRDFSKNSKLSDFIINQKKSSPDILKAHSNDDFLSCSEDKTTCLNDTRKREKKTFDRKSFEKYQQNKTLIRINKSPEERFRNITLAMVSSKGKNTENRPILTKMRFERGGVVDLASDSKKNKFKYLIKKLKKPQNDQLIHNNPKYREQAAQLIKEWWFTIKEYKKKRNESAILIQSYFRGRFVRKYLYDVIYMNYIYFGFCKKIEKFIIRKYGPYFFDIIFAKFQKQKNLLKKIIEDQNKKLLGLYLNKWNLINKKYNKKILALLYILRLRAIRESKIYNLKRVFSKWNYISIIKKERTDNKKNKKLKYDSEEIEKIKNEIEKIEKNNINKKENMYDENENEDSINKIKGLFKILNGTEKFMKKKALEMTSNNLVNYLEKIIQKNRISKINNDEILKIKIELFIKKLEPFICSNKDLYDLFMKSIIRKIHRMKSKLIKYKNKLNEPVESSEDNYIYTKEYKNTKIKKEKIEKYDIINSEDEKESEESENNNNIEQDNVNKKIDNNKSNKESNKYQKKIENIKKYYILKNLIRIKKDIDNNNIKRYFNIWKNRNNKNNNLNDENSQKSLIKIQNAIRQMISKNKLEKIKRLNNILLNIFNKKDTIKNSKLLFYLTKWNSYIKQLSCREKIEYIQKVFRKYIYNKNANKLKTFLSNAYKKFYLDTLNKFAKIKKLKSTFENISKNRIKSKIGKIIKNKRICKMLNKIIINNEELYGNDLKAYYLKKWNNRKNILKNKDNKKKKRLLMKIFNKKDNIKNVLKLYFLKWQKNHYLSLINDSARKIQKNWRRKIISDINNKRKKEQLIFVKKINDKIKKKKKNYYLYFFAKLKNLNKKYLLSQIENSFTNKRNNILKDVVNKINLYIRQKYLSKIISIPTKLKKRILSKYIKIWKNKSYIKNKKTNLLTKLINKKDHINKNLKLSYLYKWLYHSKYILMKNNIEKIQKNYRNYNKNKSIINNWINLKNDLSNKENKKEIKEIIKGIKTYIFYNKIKKGAINKSNKNNFNLLKKYYKDTLFKTKMRNIINELNNKRYPSILQKYFNKWFNKINKEIEREEKLCDLLYTIEKRMNINSVRFLSHASLIKNIYDIYAKYRKFECYKILINYSKSKKNISDFSKNLSSAFDDIKLKEKKIVLEKIFKYFVYLKLIKLLEKIKINRNKEVKQYKIKLIKYLKNKKSELSSSEKRRKKNSMQFVSPKRDQNINNIKKYDKSKTKSQSIITISDKKTKNFKEKEKEIIKKKTIKGYNPNNKKVYKNRWGSNKSNGEKNNKSISEDSENNQIKENLTAIYEPFLGALNKVINKIIIRKKKEYLIMIKKNIKIVEEEKAKEKVYYIEKLYKTLRSITIKKLFIQKNELLKAKKLINLIKITKINSQISTDRWIRQIIRRWRFIAFVKLMSKRKLELMYKNLHVGYLEIINSLFNNESQFPSIIKEFENFGSNVGMYKNSDILNKEKDLYQRVKRKYISKPIEYDKQNLINIESGKFINELKYKSDEEQGDDCNYTDSDKDIISKINNRMRRSVNYDRDKP